MTVQSAIWPSGKGLGGSSLLNYMQYLRGSRYDYDSWANAGAAGWGYKDVLPYFIKAEDQQNGEFVRTGGRHSAQCVNLYFTHGLSVSCCLCRLLFCRHLQKAFTSFFVL